ncbi:N-acetylmuramoyl-L-alanine amidase [Clostridium sp.]|uniref:N-acetylmuramoyl-L-alanine amidase n=1 Tax=Clostridium sp. TaxID=1506 RepID=UPI001A4487B5|nr:N-acetylmuramoyl-L-alanine amidase [Clostridium sp.]MBK5240565.1 N-acetylmuramoyl-L-alanine amidase [Clostridium sp.]
MKNIFKAIIFTILTVTLSVSMQKTVKASTYTDMGTKSNVVVTKEWTVNFNEDLMATSVNTTNIKVISQTNNYIDIKVSLANNNKSVIVKPVKNYEPNKTYTLIVTQKVKSAVGNPLPKEVRMNFTTETSYKIVLDAGHGGSDPGAIGPSGVQEKKVALAITLKIGNILVKNGVEAIYTRENDTYLTLQERCDVSNNARPNYFVSTHANAFTSSAVSGIETYYFPGSVAGEELAEAIQTELIKETARYDRKIKPADFYVLSHTDAAAILVETSFISNEEEEKLLITDAYQNKLAKAISTGILKCLGITNILY